MQKREGAQGWETKYSPGIELGEKKKQYINTFQVSITLKILFLKF